MSDFFTNLSQDVICINFFYKEIDVCGSKIVYLVEEEFAKKIAKTGKAYIKRPTWSIMNDISRISGVFNPFSKQYDIDVYKYRDFKLKRLLLGIEDSNGVFTKVDDKVVDSMVPQLANFILEKIDNILEIDYKDQSLTRDEAREISHEIFKYLKKKRDRDGGKLVTLPPPPSALVLYQLCEKYNILPDEARRINIRDLEIMNIVAEQTDIVNNPAKYGNGPKDKYIKF